MNLELICVGTELLLGNIVNTNAKYLSEKASEFGLNMYYQTVVGDNPERLKNTFLQSFNRSDCIILTGGLGPTKDDLTKETVSEALGLELEMDEESLTNLKNKMMRFSGRITENNYKQAMIPKGQKALQNSHGTAPGVLIEKDGKAVFIFPGPPKEMQPMFEEFAVPYFRQKTNTVISSIMIKMIGIGESSAAAELDDLIEKYTNPTIAPYAKESQVHFRVTARAESESACKMLIKPVYEEIEKRLGKYIYTTLESENIEDVVVKRLIEKQLKIAAAESCTGGLLAGTIVNVSGASGCFEEGYITYSNEGKIKNLGVKEETLKSHGAVSPECAMEMAKGAALKAGADVGVSTTGVAGPSGGTEEKPVGLVYAGLYYQGKNFAVGFRLGKDRNSLRKAAVDRALFEVLKML